MAILEKSKSWKKNRNFRFFFLLIFRTHRSKICFTGNQKHSSPKIEIFGKKNSSPKIEIFGKKILRQKSKFSVKKFFAKIEIFCKKNSSPKIEIFGKKILRQKVWFKKIPAKIRNALTSLFELYL